MRPYTLPETSMEVDNHVKPSVCRGTCSSKWMANGTLFFRVTMKSTYQAVSSHSDCSVVCGFEAFEVQAPHDLSILMCLPLILQPFDSHPQRLIHVSPSLFQPGLPVHRPTSGENPRTTCCARDARVACCSHVRLRCEPLLGGPLPWWSQLRTAALCLAARCGPWKGWRYETRRCSRKHVPFHELYEFNTIYSRFKRSCASGFLFF